MSEKERMDWLINPPLMMNSKQLSKEAIKHVGESDVFDPGSISTEPV